ncbi:MAG: hypothetical protein Q7R40_00325 [Phaeospirillum sp.]|nr:hypothetical protein [Phaeospirillum sp.]
MTTDSGMTSIYNIGSEAAKFLKPGVAVVNYSVNVLAVQTLAVLNLGKRTTGALPWLTWEFGMNFDTGTDYGFQVQDCKVQSMDISLEAGGLLQATLSGAGGLITDLSTIAMAHLSETPMHAYEAVLTRGGAADEAIGFRFNVDHSVEVTSVIAGAAPSTFKRGWKYQTEGNEVITGEVTRLKRCTLDLQATTIADFSLVLTCTDIVGGMSPNTITLTATGAKFGSERFAGTVDGLATFTTPFIAKAFTIA